MDAGWSEAVKQLSPYVFKILTPRGAGTGCLISVMRNNICGVATALHVIEHEHTWDNPIKIIHHESNKELILRKPEERVIITFNKEDLAFIVFPKQDLKLPDKMLEIIPPDRFVSQGVQMGWCGFPFLPYVTQNSLCFFTGRVSAYLHDSEFYLVDGVAINGVSGGPAFTIRNNAPRLCGIVSAYIANRATGETLPGVSVVRDVAPYQPILQRLSSMEKAKREAEALGEEAQKPLIDSAPSKKKAPKKKAGKKKEAKK